MTHQLLAEVMSTALMIIFGVGVHCDDVLKEQNMLELDTYSRSQHGHSVSLSACSSLAAFQ